jgi:hypothetical protein
MPTLETVAALRPNRLELWNHAEAPPIDLGDLETVREIVSDNLDRSFFGTRFQMATDSE